MDSKIRFYNAKICTMESGTDIIEGELWTRGGEIAHVGAPADCSGESFDRELDMDGKLIIPGFKNAHAHSPMTFLRSLADDLPLDRWLNELVFPMEAKLRGEDIYTLYQLAVLEYLSGGITAAFDMYPFSPEMAAAAVDSGFRAVFCGAFNDFSGSLAGLERDFLELNALNERVSFRLGFHAEYTTNAENLAKLAALAERYRAPVYFHCAETKKETEECVGRYGMTPVALTESLGLLDYGGGIFHGVYLTAEDAAILARRGVGVVTNPASNCKLSSGIAPLGMIRGSGVTLGLGTDGAASNNALDMFREMYLASMLQKLSTGNASALEAGQALEMACVGGAKIMGLDDCTSLSPGKSADLAVIDLKQPNMQPENNIIKNLVYAGGRQNVCLTMVGGRILYENGKFAIGREPEEIYAEANRIVSQMRG